MNKHTKNIIVITGASSGFGALAARALAKAGRKAPPSPFFGCDFNLTIVRRHERSYL
jgi:hypothetical protein